MKIAETQEYVSASRQASASVDSIRQSCPLRRENASLRFGNDWVTHDVICAKGVKDLQAVFHPVLREVHARCDELVFPHVFHVFLA